MSEEKTALKTTAKISELKLMMGELLLTKKDDDEIDLNYIMAKCYPEFSKKMVEECQQIYVAGYEKAVQDMTQKLKEANEKQKENEINNDTTKESK